VATNGQQPSREQVREAQKESAEHSAAVSTGAQQAAGQTIADAVNDPSIVDEFIRTGIDDKDLLDRLDAEMSTHVALANLTEKEYEDERIMDRARHCLARCELPDEGGVGSKCRGEVREMMLADQNAPTGQPPELTGDRDRELAAAYEERSNARSLAKNARLLEALTEAIVYNRNDRRDDSGEDRGLVDRAVSRIL
jgi:hypothetical protein